MREKFKSVYQPEQEIAITVSQMMWKGRLGWKQYIPSKRAHFGIKSYELCESKSGYICWDFFIYTGKDTDYHADYEDNSSTGAKVVLYPLLGQGYGINMGNFFSSPDLFDYLCQRHTIQRRSFYLCCGYTQMQQKRSACPSATEKIEKGGKFAMYLDKLMVLKWKGKKDVYMLSTYHEGERLDVRTRGRVEVSKPKVCIDYNNTMRGVDLSDAYLTCYPTARKRLKSINKNNSIISWTCPP